MRLREPDIALFNDLVAKTEGEITNITVMMECGLEHEPANWALSRLCRGGLLKRVASGRYEIAESPR